MLSQWLEALMTRLRRLIERARRRWLRPARVWMRRRLPWLVAWAGAAWRPVLRGVDFGREVLEEFLGDECPEMAAAMAYYIVFSLPALLLVAVDLTGLFFSAEEVSRQVALRMSSLLGAEVAHQIVAMTQALERSGGDAGFISGTLSMVALAFGATGGFAQVQRALNKAWQVAPDPGQSAIKNFLLKRLVSFCVVLCVGVLLVTSLLASSLITAFGDVLARWLSWDLSAGALVLLDTTMVFGLFTLLFGVMFRLLPDAEVAWRDAWLGALVTSGLMIVGKWFVSLYLRHSTSAEAIGAASSLALVFIWIYYSAMMLLLGAEFTQVWARRRDRTIRPAPGAIARPRRQLAAPDSAAARQVSAALASAPEAPPDERRTDAADAQAAASPPADARPAASPPADARPAASPPADTPTR